MKIIWTDAAKYDLHDIRQHLAVNQSKEYVVKATQEIRDEVASLKTWKNEGTYVEELEELHLTQYKQLLAGQNRIIIEKESDELIYVHLVCHTSRDLEALLRRRLLTI